MKIQFLKMSGAGNDFIMIDSRDGNYTSLITAELIEKLCRRGLSLGADGVIELKSDSSSTFAMKYYNSDGNPAEMCGNGARCICRFAAELGVVTAGKQFSFVSDAGEHRGLVTADTEARIWMTDPQLHFLEKDFELHSTQSVGFANTGVPHAVVFVDDLENGSFERNASDLRSHPEFGDSGANANWVKILPDKSLEMRTFERGVEGETLACGTGAVASALIAVERFDSITLPVRIRVRSGLDLTVGRDSNGWWLQGEARIVYRGEIVS